MGDVTHLDGLIDLLVEAVVRELENENGPGSQQTKPQAVKDERDQDYHGDPDRAAER